MCLCMAQQLSWSVCVEQKHQIAEALYPRPVWEEAAAAAAAAAALCHLTVRVRPAETN